MGSIGSQLLGLLQDSGTGSFSHTKILDIIAHTMALIIIGHAYMLGTLPVTDALIYLGITGASANTSKMISTWGNVKSGKSNGS